ncbi:unnamed protein product [Chondrus crispus]|uniref:Uncharacterized protein n=1 Tax=Chondrus crispus TaxID=2769 RepID=R7QNU0_CHOCR|nr:unnamed protein product [Chondrus crispus]CDF40167.1 unnamed protein product [Chondrus crispus]|eukprot:XP_005710461.1 unnamed protein product [Chondrus crispus]
MSPNPAGSTALPPKEANLFKAVVRLYETKQLKKALKSADSILKRFPHHGETLAMKGLTLNALDKKPEATDLVRRGLRMDMRSHICWHVYGLLYRSDRDYREAAKAYLNALKFDKDNQQILRDLALLQIQIRDYEGLEDTRRTLLTVRPSQRHNWIGFALSFHLLDNYSMAVSVLDTYRETLKQSNDPEDRYEASELLLYKAFVLEESGEHAAALQHIADCGPKLVDKLALRETKARILGALGRFDEAAEELVALLRINPDNRIYQRGLQSFRICSANEKQPKEPNGVMSYERPLSEQFPRSRTAQRIALDILPSAEHPEFIPRVDAYVRKFLRKGVSSLFSDMRPLYSNPTKAAALGKLFENFRQSLEKGDHSTASKQNGSDGNAPTPVLLWVLHFLAQHYDCLRQYDRALDTIEKAIELSPATVECYLVKAKILKHCGDPKKAVDVCDEARKLDLADRYLNTKCSEYALQANMVPEAEAWVALFTRDADSGGIQALYDMQCMWFELGAAESYLRRGQLSQALKHFTAVERHFADMVEDQFDFHSYCIRKVTLRAYVRLLRFEDHIRNHPYYSRAASGIAQCLLRLYDLPERERNMLTGEHADIEGFAEMTDAQRKKAISKRKKQLARQRQTQHGTSGSKGSGKHPTNPGRPTANGSDPILEEATRIVRELERNLSDRLQTQVISFELAIRKRKYLQALRAVRRAQRMYPEDAKTLEISVKLAHEIAKSNARESFSEVVKSVYDCEGDILGGKKPTEFIENYVQKNRSYAERRVGAARCKLWLAKNGEKGVGSLEEICKSLTKAIDECEVDGALVNFLSADFMRDLLIELKRSGIDAKWFSLVVESCRAKYPRSSWF